MSVHVKICGVTTPEDARGAADLGASAVGLNFVPASPRCIDAARARRIVAEVKGRALIVGVVADLSVDAMRALMESAGLECLQLHGDEPDDTLRALLPHAYKAVRIGSSADVAHARTFSGEHLLVDARVEGALGGTGKTVDWSLVAPLAQERKLTLAGGLGPHNVADAVRAVRPYCVDVSSGVESSPGVKDRAKVKAFIDAAKGAGA